MVASKELKAETSKVLIPGEKSIVHLQSMGETVRRGKQKHRLTIDEQFAAAKFRNRHVCHGKTLDYTPGGDGNQAIWG